mgnify:CR=1 FL=1
MPDALDDTPLRVARRALRTAVQIWVEAHVDELTQRLPGPPTRSFIAQWVREALIPEALDEGIAAVVACYSDGLVAPNPPIPTHGCYVYRLLGHDGCLLYIGSSRHLSARIRQHRRDRGDLIAHVTWDQYDTEADMLQGEVDAIHDELPPLNFRDVG